MFVISYINCTIPEKHRNPASYCQPNWFWLFIVCYFVCGWNGKKNEYFIFNGSIFSLQGSVIKPQKCKSNLYQVYVYLFIFTLQFKNFEEYENLMIFSVS